ncbi:chloramphenicol acetyltransferase [Hymenobacter aerilatus]|uniref:Chloramphenicol acetyltransferase n=1 Tax=Hymenobacter aerilatus TaxID=2932251 RepID=A0A8T9SYA5_9BACT|nr:chloramphenicol acetyltransferase [Hymenobacter aerilatus]UOR06687.1 chloramphenicol acetyltransferase [Hymenobacter aerilatus]
MKHRVDLTTWNRREHFAFFSTFDEPFFGLVAPVDCTQARAEARRLGVSFFLYYLYHSLQAANQVPEFRTRIENGEVYQYDQIHASATIGRADHTFGFSFIELHDALPDFVAAATAEIAAVQASTGLRLNDTTGRPDVVHCSAIPWVRFSGLTHARSFRHPDSCPKISYGQTYEENGRLWLPVAVNVHHGLADGYHVGQFLAAFQQGLNGGVEGRKAGG